MLNVEDEGINSAKSTGNKDDTPAEMDSRLIDSLGRLGFLLHQETGAGTSEGLGSHARGNIFPLIQISQQANLIPCFENESLTKNMGRDYSALDMASFLDIDHRYSVDELKQKCTVVEVSTWSDPIIGVACGDATVLAGLISDHLETVKIPAKPVLVIMYGELRYIDPVAPVHTWLQERSSVWKQELNASMIRVVVHVRVPEEWCGAVWKDDNSIDKISTALLDLQEAEPKALTGHLDIFTEQTFPVEAENIINKHFPNAVVHRGTSSTMLGDLKAMACADILVVSASHFSALAGYLCTPPCLIVLANADNKYFHQHIQLGCHVVTAKQPDFQDIVKRKVANFSAAITDRK